MAKGPDVLTPEQRAAELARGRPRNLPLAPLAPPARRKLPLADSVRPRDEQARPIYCVWEITLQCDLAFRAWGAPAGHKREGELTTEECLDLVRQMAELGVMEVTLIGGEAYLRDDWTDIIREIRRRGMSATMTSGGRGNTAQKTRAAKEAGLESVSISIDGNEVTHDRLRGVKGSYQSAFRAMDLLREAGVKVSTNTQI